MPLPISGAVRGAACCLALLAGGAWAATPEARLLGDIERARGSAVCAAPTTRAHAPLILKPGLSAAAREQAVYLARLGRPVHRAADGSTPAQRAARHGVRARKITEIVYIGQRSDPQRAVNWWLRDELHCRILLDGGLTRAGLSVVHLGANTAFVVVLSTPQP